MESVERDVLTAIYNSRERLGRIVEQAKSQGDPWLEQQGYKGSIYLRKALDAIHALPGGRIVPDRSQFNSEIYRTIKLAHDTIDEFAENSSPHGREGIVALNDLRTAMTEMLVGREGVASRAITRNHHYPFLSTERGMLVVREWYSGELLPHYSGIALSAKGGETKNYVLTVLEKGERSINYLTARTDEEAEAEAQALPEKLERLQKQEAERLAVSGAGAGESLVRAGRWYPLLKQGELDWVYVTSVKDDRVMGYSDPANLSWHTWPVKTSLADFKAMLPAAIEKAITQNEVALTHLKASGMPDNLLITMRDEVQYLKDLKTGKLADVQHIDDRMLFNVRLGPADDSLEPVDHRLYLKAILDNEKDPAVVIEAIELDYPEDVEPYLSPEAKRLLDQYPAERESAGHGMRL